MDQVGESREDRVAFERALAEVGNNPVPFERFRKSSPGHPGPRRARPRVDALLALCALGLLGCRSAVKADPREWTVERALSVIRDVEERQVESVRLQESNFPFKPSHGVEVYPEPIGLPDGDPEAWSATVNPDGFEDIRIVRKEALPDVPPTGWEIAAMTVVALSSFAGGGTPVGPGHGHRFRAIYGFRHVAFADIKRVVIAHKDYPLLCLSIVFGPWVHDVVLEMKDGTQFIVYQQGGGWLNVFPVWLYPAYWLHTTESYEFAEAIEYLRARAAGGAGGTAGPGE